MKNKKKIIIYKIHIYRTKRNSIFNLTTRSGKSLLIYTIGQLGFTGTKKKRSIIHYFVASLFAKKIKKTYKELILFKIIFKGRKSFRKTIIKAFINANINFYKKIIDKTPLSFNGCKKKK